MQNVEISVIVPVYKAESYLRRCIDSILSQTFYNFELLLIDDGSPDTSGRICDEYAIVDKRVRVFHRQNSGVSATRQFGIDNAIGQYTIHADPDDWMDVNYLAVLHKEAICTDADIIICDFYKETRSGSEYVSQMFIGHLPKDILKQFLLHKLHGALWNKLIRRSLYTTYQVRFPSYNCWEDLFVCCSLLTHNVTVSYINKAFYHYDYFSNVNSIVRKQKLMSLQSQISFINYFEPILNEEEFSDVFIFLKCEEKCKVFASGILCYKDFYNLFREINPYYMKMFKGWMFLFNIIIFKYNYVGEAVWSILRLIRLLQKKR